jgi:DNA-binding LacI/PurR family transcriptional regulator
MNDKLTNRLKDIKSSGKDSSGPIYLRIRKELENMIISGELPDNYRLPSDMELASIIGVTHITLGKALNELRKQGLLQRNRSRGTFVKAPTTDQELIPGEKSKLVAVIFDDVNRTTFQSELFISLHDNLQKNGLEMLFLSSSGRDSIQFEQVKGILQKPNCCGCLLWSILETNQVRDLMKIKPVDFPLIFMDKHYEEVGHDCSIYDSTNAARSLGRLLLNRNYKKMVFLIREKNLKYNSPLNRYYGLREAFAEKNLDPDNVVLYRLDENKPFNLDEINSLVPNGVVIAAVAELAVKLKLQLEEENPHGANIFPLISFGPSSFGISLADRNISEMHFSPADLGKNSVDILLERLNGDHSGWKRATAKAVFVERASSMKVKEYAL